MAQKATVSILP